MMQRWILRLLMWSTLLGLLVAAAGCGGGSDSMDVAPDEVDESTPATITDTERAAFEAPPDSVLTSEQVEQYLKTSLLQFDLVRKHSEAIQERVAEMEQRDQEGGAFAGLRNMMDAGRTMMEFSEVIGGSFVRSARALGHNPAEMEWVRERMTEAAAYLAYAPARDGMREGAEEARAEFEAMRREMEDGGTAGGYSQEDFDAILQYTEAMERSMDVEPTGAVADNIEVLHRARPNVTDAMWTTIGLSAGTMGLAALAGLSDPNDEEARAQLDDLRTLYTDALENRVTPGMGPGQ